MSNTTHRVVKDFERLKDAVAEQIKLAYSAGFSDHLVTFTNKDSEKRKRLSFKT